MQISGTAVAVATLLVWWLVQEPNKVVPTEKTSLMQDFAISLRSPVLSSLMFVSFLAWIYGAAVGPLIAVYLPKMQPGLRDNTLGIIYALPSVAFVLMARRWTEAGEKWGFERTIILGLIGGAVGVIALAAAPGVWVFGFIYFVAGLWLAAIGPSTGAITCTLVENTFRGRAYGMQQAAGTFGALIAPIAAAQIGNWMGMRSVFVAVGVLFLGGAFAFRSMVRRWESPQPEEFQAPTDDMHPDPVIQESE